MNTVKAQKPEYNFINADTIEQQIDDCILDFFTGFNIDLNDLKTVKSIPHNTINLCLRHIYKSLFKPDKPLYNNQKSLINYDDVELLTLLANKFIDICLYFNKSLGLMSFGFMLGIDYSTLARWLSDETLNPKRSAVLKSVKECHKVQQIGLLNDTPVGALAVANNDHETGLEWSKNQMQVTAQSVYFLPSERVDRMRLAKPEENNDSV